MEPLLSDRPRSPCRRRKVPGVALGIVGHLNKLMNLLDGSSRVLSDSDNDTFRSSLQRSFDNVYAGERSVAVVYSSEKHTAERVLDCRAMFRRMEDWANSYARVEIRDIRPLADSLIEYTLHITNENNNTRNNNMILVCTATLLGDKVISSIEKIVSADENKTKYLLPKREASLSLADIGEQRECYSGSEDHSNSTAGMSNSCSSSTSSALCRGTSLENLEHLGGSVFMNACTDQENVTKVIFITHQSDDPGDMEIVECHPPSRYEVKSRKVDKKNKRRNKDTHSEPCFLLRDCTSSHNPIVLCRRELGTPEQETTIYFIDGSFPLHSEDVCVQTQADTDFFPRYKFDVSKKEIQVWNGLSYEPFTEASEEGAQNGPRSKLAMGRLLGNREPCGMISERPECVAHIATKNGTNLLRAKIKIPAGQDPSLMICLTAISDFHRGYSRDQVKGKKPFTTLRLPASARASLEPTIGRIDHL